MSFHVLICGECTQTWLQEVGWRAQESVSCPHCGTERDPKKVKQVSEGEILANREQAAEWRARYDAERADEREVYDRFTETNGFYPEQEADIFETIDASIPEIDAENLRPIMADKFGSLVEASLEAHRRKYELWVDEYCTDPRDELADEITLEEPGHRIFEFDIQPDLEQWAARPDRADLPRGEVTPTDQAPASSLTHLEIDSDTTVTQLWESLFEHETTRTTLAESIQTLFGDLEPVGVYHALEDLSIPYWIRSSIVNATRGDSTVAGELVAEALPTIHQNPQAATEDLLASAQLFGGVDDRTLAILIDESWLESRRDQRVDVCDLLSVLASSFDVRVVGSGITLSKVAQTHRVDLPGVSEWCTRQRDSSSIDADAKATAADLETGSFELEVLRALYADPSGILSYTELYDRYPGDNDSRVRQVIGGFVDDKILERFGPQHARKVELRPFGERVLEYFERETARQQSISDYVDEAVNPVGKQDRQGRVSTETGLGGGEDGDDSTAYYRTRYLGLGEHAAVAATGGNGGVTLVRGGIDDHEKRTRYVSYDDERREAVVAVRAGEPLPLTVSSALALASKEFVDRVLTPRRLESLDESPAIVRDARCIGGASDAALEDGQQFRNNLIQWGEELSRLTTELKRGECDDRDSFRSTIVRSAHGLWGTIAHILNALDITLHREIRVPAGLKREKREAFAESLAHAAAVQSEYRDSHASYACFRQLFEDRSDKRRAAMEPTVDAADPTGSLIGSFVLRGPDVDKLEEPLRDLLESPKNVHDDAPEFGVEIDVRAEPDRLAYADTLRRVLGRKNLRPTPEAVAVTHALVETPQAAARMLHRHLSVEDSRRDIRADELRTAFKNLEPAALVPDLGTTQRRTTSAGKIVKALLEADEPLSKSGLATRADVSPKTVYNYRDPLEVLDLLRVDDDGYRLALSFPTSEERHEPMWPEFANGYLLEAVDAYLSTVLPPDRYADADDDLGGVLFWPQDPWRLLEHNETDSWIRLAAKLTGETPPTEEESKLLMGPVNRQQAFKTAIQQAAAD